MNTNGTTVKKNCSDHGWKLGEHGDWSKCTNWETDARVPLLIRAPWITPAVDVPKGDAASTMAMGELVDLFPTAVDLAGLPAVPSTEGLEGKSLVPVLKDPQGEHPERVAAFSQYPRCPQYNMKTQSTQWECLQTPKANITRMGYSVRTAEARCELPCH